MMYFFYFLYVCVYLLYGKQHWQNKLLRKSVLSTQAVQWKTTGHNLKKLLLVKKECITFKKGQHNILRNRYRSSLQWCFIKNGALKNFAKFTGKHLCKSLFFNKVAALNPVTLLKKTLAQVFSCEFCEIYKNIFYRTPTCMFLQNMGDCFCIIHYSYFQMFCLVD